MVSKGESRPQPLASPTGPEKAEAGPSKTKPHRVRRPVRQLTQAQLARKRATDREAQRNVRQKTKEYIEALEKDLRDRIEQVTSLETKNKFLETKVTQLQRAVKTVSVEEVHSHIPFLTKGPDLPSQGTVVSGNSHNNSYWSTPEIIPLIPPDTYEDLTIRSATRTLSSYTGTPDTRSSMGSFSSDNGMLPTTYPPAPTSDWKPTSHPGSRLYNEDYIPDFTHMTAATPTARYMPPTSMVSNTSSSPAVLYAPPTSMVPSTSNSAIGNDNDDFVSTCWKIQPSVYQWQISTKLSYPDNPMDQLMLSIIQSQRHLASTTNATREQLCGPNSPSIHQLFGRSGPANVHPLSQTITTGVSNLAAIIPTIPKQVGTFLATYRLYQWLIDPQKDTYNNLLPWQAPHSSQLSIPHPPWMDFPPWAAFRDKIIQDQQKYGTQEFLIAYTMNLELNWPFDPWEAVTVVGGEMRVSELTEKQLGDLGNMRMTTKFRTQYPEFAGICRFVDE